MKRLVAGVALALLSACGESPSCPAATLPALSEAPSFAVITSDYTSTAVALLDARGELMDEAWVDSGSAEAGIVAALSGDVSLPSEPLVAGELTAIDRFGVDVIGRFDLRGGGVLSQLDAQLRPEEGGGGFRSNPQDVVLLADGTLLVSRFEPNYDPGAPALDRGNDLVRVGDDGPISRIAMDDLDTTTPAGTHAFARPARITRLGARFVVGLGRLSQDFMEAGGGAVALVTVDPPSAAPLDLPGLTNCPAVKASPDGDAVIVLCVGQTFELAGGRRAGAGLARIVDGDAGPEVAEIWRAADHPEVAVPTLEPVPLGGSVVAVPALDEGGTDQLLVVELDGGATVVHRAAREFVIGVGAYDPVAELLVVPEADEGVLRFEVDGASLTELGPIDPSPCRRLPPREIGRLSP